MKRRDALDHPLVSARLFHPRPEGVRSPSGGEAVAIPVDGGCVLGGTYHRGAGDVPLVLFFHGNGEIAADYDDLGPLFVRVGVGLLVVDYRGYGRSTGRPSAGTLLEDAHRVLDFVRDGKLGRPLGAPIVVGRSLGSAPALELASARSPDVAALVVESGFTRTLPLLETLGLDPAALGLREEDGFHNLEKIRRYEGPTVVIHGEQDRLIPPENAHEFMEASGATEKRLLLLRDADHNTVFLVGLSEYLGVISALARRVVRQINENAGSRSR